MYQSAKNAPLNGHLTDADVFLTRAEAAEILRRSVPTLERWARQGIGPDHIRVGGRVLYPLLAVRRYAERGE